MSLKPVGLSLTTAIFLLSLSTAVMAQTATNTHTQVLTPFGYRDTANVHLVPPGYNLTTMPDGHIRMANPTTGAYVDFPKMGTTRCCTVFRQRLDHLRELAEPNGITR